MFDLSRLLYGEHSGPRIKWNPQQEKALCGIRKSNPRAAFKDLVRIFREQTGVERTAAALKPRWAKLSIEQQPADVPSQIQNIRAGGDEGVLPQSDSRKTKKCFGGSSPSSW
ncbi:unnamed protein product [Enterobius vermicularis]|uniref:Uncharacterized protein n=1 Tax=Enterobius vermicularis TaxID=51028 RepID=A0A0N4VQG1_ENTVE|nr:unnamed protein product [Enterobius vermicularis]